MTNKVLTLLGWGGPVQRLQAGEFDPGQPGKFINVGTFSGVNPLNGFATAVFVYIGHPDVHDFLQRAACSPVAGTVCASSDMG